MVKLLLALLAAHSALAQFPGRSWERRTPESQGVDPTALNNAFNYAIPALSLTTHCVAVFRNGFLIGDRYRVGVNPTDPHVSWSITKAVFGTMMGIAERNGRLRTTDLASQYIPEWRTIARAQDITIDHLLRHDSGRYFEALADFIIPQDSANQTLYALGLPMTHAPGANYQYNQMAFQCMERIWRVAHGGRTMASMFDELIARPLGFESSAFVQQVSFVVNRANGDGGLVYGGAHMSCQDLGRFGHLWLNNNRWNGVEITTPDFVTKALSLPGAGRAGRRYHWGDGPNFRANGLGDQLIVFNRALNLVIARLGDMAGLGFSGSQFIDRVVASVRTDDNTTLSYTPTPEDEVDPVEVQVGEYLRQRLGLA